MSDRFRVSRQLLVSLEDRGVPLQRVLRSAGLPAGLLAQERILLDTEEFFALWRAVAGENPGVGLQLGAQLPVERYDPAAIAALSSRSYRDALARIARYKQLSCPEEIRIVPDPPEGTAVQFVFTRGGAAEPHLLVDLCLSWILAVGQRGTGQPLTPLHVEVTREHDDHLRGHFGCAILFGASRNALVMRDADVDLPFVTHNEQLLGMLAPHLEQELSERSSLEQQARSVLKKLLAGHHPRLPEVADQLRMSPRTLQRRLTEAGSTFQKVLDDARRELAHHYLAEGGLQLVETAYLLGYEDSNSFVRAFQRWEGMPPGRWRSQQLVTR